jgi:hypothetical protein
VSDLVKSGAHILPRALVEVWPPQPGACPQCGGAGEFPESIDPERYDVMVPCFRCRAYCATCKAWMPKGHQHG